MVGIYHPMLMLPAPFPHHKPGGEAQIITTIPICEMHRRQLTARDFIADEGWEQLCDGFRQIGKMEPDRDKVWIKWIKIEDSPAKNLKSKA
jgi:hypothetical protein